MEFQHTLVFAAGLAVSAAIVPPMFIWTVVVLVVNEFYRLVCGREEEG